MVIEQGYKCGCGCIELEEKTLSLYGADNDDLLKEITYTECKSCHTCYLIEEE